MERAIELRAVEVPAAEAKSALTVWREIPEKERGDFRVLLLQLRDSLISAKTADDARKKLSEIIDKNADKFSSKGLEYLVSLKRHSWDERTWSQRLIVLSFMATLPLYAGKAAGLAMLGTGFRVAIPLLGAAATSLVGSGLDLAVSSYRKLAAKETKENEDYLDRITFDQKQHGGHPCVRGRVLVKDILGALANGSTRDEILHAYSDLEDADITAALQFACRTIDHPVITRRAIIGKSRGRTTVLKSTS